MSRMIVRRLMRQLLPPAASLRLRREWLGRRLAAGKGAFENDVPLLKTYVKQTDICWDIGANIGLYTLHLSRLASIVFAFEPVPHSADTLRDVKRRAHLENVVVRQLALSDQVGRARMKVPVHGFYGGFYLAQLDAAGELDVEVSTIDALIASGVPEPDFIKCDVEGAESRVLAGARELLARSRPIWLLETFEDGVVELLRSLGYSAYARDDDNRLVEVQSRVHERNYWFFPAPLKPQDAFPELTSSAPRRECPACGSTAICRSRLRWHELPWRMSSTRPYRCDDCDARFWSSPNAKPLEHEHL